MPIRVYHDQWFDGIIKMHQYLAKFRLTNKQNERNAMPDKTINENVAQESIPQKFQAFIIPLGVSAIWWGLGQMWTVWDCHDIDPTVAACPMWKTCKNRFLFMWKDLFHCLWSPGCFSLVVALTMLCATWTCFVTRECKAEIERYA